MIGLKSSLVTFRRRSGRLHGEYALRRVSHENRGGHLGIAVVIGRLHDQPVARPGQDDSGQRPVGIGIDICRLQGFAVHLHKDGAEPAQRVRCSPVQRGRGRENGRTVERIGDGHIRRRRGVNRAL